MKKATAEATITALHCLSGQIVSDNEPPSKSGEDFLRIGYNNTILHASTVMFRPRGLKVQILKPA